MILHALHALVHVHGRCSYIFGEDWCGLLLVVFFFLFSHPLKKYILVLLFLVFQFQFQFLFFLFLIFVHGQFSIKFFNFNLSFIIFFNLVIILLIFFSWFFCLSFIGFQFYPSIKKISIKSFNSNLSFIIFFNLVTILLIFIFFPWFFC